MDIGALFFVFGLTFSLEFRFGGRPAVFAVPVSLASTRSDPRASERFSSRTRFQFILVMTTPGPWSTISSVCLVTAPQTQIA